MKLAGIKINASWTQVILRRNDFLTFPLIVVSLYFGALFFYTVLNRIAFPLELELIEGSLVNHTLRVMQGELLYTKPSFEFTPNLYTPLFYYCGVVLSFVQGVGFLSLRMVSFLATVATFILIGLFVYRETKSGVAAFVAGSLYLATYAASGGWMDLARVDSLFVALLLFAVYLMRYAQGAAGLIVSALVFVLAFYAKQSTLIAVMPLMLYPLLYPPGNANRLLLPFIFFATLLFSLGIMDWMTDRWSTYYTMVMPYGHPNNSNNTKEFWRHDLILVMPVAMLCALALIVWLLVQKKNKDAAFFVIFLVAMAVTSYLTRINKGGYYNNLMPVYAALGIVFGILLGKVITELASSRYWLTVMLVASLFQFWLLSYDPRSYIPTQEDWLESARLVDDLRKEDGNIYSLDFGFIGYLAGKKNFSHSTSSGDIKLSRYQDWAGLSFHQDPERVMSEMLAGLDRNNVNTLVLINDSNGSLDARMGDFSFKARYPGVRREGAWSRSDFWVRSWPTRTMFFMPDILLYVRSSDPGENTPKE